jgi:uncharacterized protein YcbX
VSGSPGQQAPELRVAALWRYPVKSMGGERVESAAVTERGIEGDRAWGLLQVSTGRILTARRRPELLFASARMAGTDVVVTLPDGHETTDDGELSDWLGEPVRLVAAVEQGTGTYETPIDAEAEDAAPWMSWTGPEGSFHDSTKSRVSLVSTATLGDWDIRRFRTNIVLEGSGEDALIGSNVVLGNALLSVLKPIDRCVMVSRPQPGLDRDLDVLRTINRERASLLSVGAIVARPGMIRVGDRLSRGNP